MAILVIVGPAGLHGQEESDIAGREGLLGTFERYDRIIRNWRQIARKRSEPPVRLEPEDEVEEEAEAGGATWFRTKAKRSEPTRDAIQSVQLKNASTRARTTRKENGREPKTIHHMGKI